MPALVDMPAPAMTTTFEHLLRYSAAVFKSNAFKTGSSTGSSDFAEPKKPANWFKTKRQGGSETMQSVGPGIRTLLKTGRLILFIVAIVFVSGFSRF